MGRVEGVVWWRRGGVVEERCGGGGGVVEAVMWWRRWCCGSGGVVKAAIWWRLRGVVEAVKRNMFSYYYDGVLLPIAYYYAEEDNYFNIASIHPICNATVYSNLSLS